MKSGLEYFPLDTSLDTKFELIEAEFGLTGFSVVVKLFQRIYGQEGYYCEVNDEVILLFSKQVNLGCNVVSEIINAAVRRGIFDSVMYDRYSILTSRGIQTRYFEACRRREKIEVNKNSSWSSHIRNTKMYAFRVKMSTFQAKMLTSANKVKRVK